MTEQNFPDNTIYELDNLRVLRGMNSGTVDLIATDPPFNTRRSRTGTGAAGSYVDSWRWGDTGKLPDTWAWNEVNPAWLDDMRQQNPTLHDLHQTVAACSGQDTAAFLCFLSVRLLEMHRVLKPQGSIYLHCDHNANAHIRLALDAIFGARNFRSEIIWKRTTRGFKGSKFPPKNYTSNTDTILYYVKSDRAPFHMDRVLTPYEPNYLEKAFRLKDDTGTYYLDTAYNRPSARPSPSLCYEYRGFNPPHPSGWKLSRPTMERLDRDGELVVQDQQLHRKIRPKDGTTRSNLWDDINEVKGHESTGSPDQKPTALYERMVLASSNPGDLVLDPFAGCATTIIAARNHGRRWVGIDRRKDAHLQVLCRLMGTTAAGHARALRERPDISEWMRTQMAAYDTHFSENAPVRTDQAGQGE